MSIRVTSSNPADLVAPLSDDPGADLETRNNQYLADAHKKLSPAENHSARTMEAAVKAIFAVKRETAAELAELDRKRDRRAEHASSDYRQETQKKQAAIEQADKQKISRIIEEKYLPAEQTFRVADAIMKDLGGPTARDAAHQAAITHQCLTWDGNLPEINLRVVNRAIAAGDRALAAALKPKLETSIGLAQAGKRAYWQPYVIQGLAALDKLDMLIQTEYSVRAKLAVKIADHRRAGLRAFLNILREPSSANDSTMLDLAARALDGYEDTSWLSAK